MVAYNFKKRFVPYIEAGLEPGPWLPGMKRHTLRQPRAGRSRHARPEEDLQLYTDQRSKRARKIGQPACRLLMPVQLLWNGDGLAIRRREGEELCGDVLQLAPIVLAIRASPIEGGGFSHHYMDEFARSDGFADQQEMTRFFKPPEPPAGRIATLNLVLIGWAPGDPT